MASVFDLQVPRERCSANFLIVAEQPAHRCTRLLVDDLFSRFTDKDGGFVERFQTTEFESRLWELYLFACLEEAGVTLDHTYNRPDFHGVLDAQPFFIEAVTTNPPPGGQSPNSAARVEGDKAEAADAHMMRVVRAIAQKVRKDYQALSWVQGMPLAIAVAPFHGATSLHFTDTGLQRYLYGLEPSADNRLVPVTSTSIGDRTVELGWFNKEESRPFGAIIYSVGATVGKFHRMSVQKGLGPKDGTLALIHRGLKYDPDPKALATSFRLCC